jgi:hypothetical protein
MARTLPEVGRGRGQGIGLFGTTTTESALNTKRMHTLDRILKFLNTALLVAILMALVEINRRMPSAPPTSEELASAGKDDRKIEMLKKRMPHVFVEGSVFVDNTVTVEPDILQGFEVWLPNAVEVRTDPRDPLEVHITRDR